MWDKIPLDNKTIIKRNEEKNMKKKTIQTLVAIPFALTAFAFTTQSNAQETVDMHRLYNPNSGEHFYTANTAEKDHLVKVGWKYEGLGWLAPKAENDYPVYRVYNPNAGDHHYTMDIDEMSDLVYKHGWKFEGIGWYSDQQKGKALYRAYNPNAKAGSHNYTTNLAEQKNLLKVGWKDEGISWYGVDPNKKDEPANVTPPKDNNQNQGGQTTPPNTSPDNGGTSTTPKDNGGVQDGQTTPPKTATDDGGNVTPPVDQTPSYDKVIPAGFQLDSRAVAKEVLELLNADRKKVGAQPLEWNEDIYKCAEIRADELVKSYSHTRPDGRKAYSVRDDLGFGEELHLGTENIAMVYKGVSNKDIAYNLYQKWYNSPSHKKAMLNGFFKHYGSAYTLSTSQGYLCVYGDMLLGK